MLPKGSPNMQSKANVFETEFSFVSVPGRSLGFLVFFPA